MIHTQTDKFAEAGQIDTQKIPVIDLCEWFAVRKTPAAKKPMKEVGAAIHAAAKNLGFFYISGHGIDDALVQSALAATKNFFTLPEKSKAFVAVNQDQKGWMRPGMANLEGAKTHDLKEVFFYGREITSDDVDLRANLPMVSENQWPDSSLPAFKHSIVEYHTALCAVGEAVLSAIAVGFNLAPDFFHSYYRRPLARGQLVFYPPSSDDDEKEERYGVAPHTDFGVLTLLVQDDSGGLQIQSKRDGWIEAPPIPGTIVCNTGDLLERWTDGLFPSTLHRVINRSGQARYSMPLFYDPSSDARIDASDLNLNPKSPVPSITAGEHIASRNRKNFSQYK